MDTEYTKAFKAGYDFGYKDAANENRYNTGVKVGIAYEQDRIIELLNDWKCGHPNCDGDKTEVCYPKHYLIQSIKGEK